MFNSIDTLMNPELEQQLIVIKVQLINNKYKQVKYQHINKINGRLSSFTFRTNSFQYFPNILHLIDISL